MRNCTQNAVKTECAYARSLSPTFPLPLPLTLPLSLPLTLPLPLPCPRSFPLSFPLPLPLNLSQIDGQTATSENIIPLLIGSDQAGSLIHM